jgi:hypothetical protein
VGIGRSLSRLPSTAVQMAVLVMAFVVQTAHVGALKGLPEMIVPWLVPPVIAPSVLVMGRVARLVPAAAKMGSGEVVVPRCAR